MKKTTQIHIGGQHFMIDEDAFEKLGHYIDSLKAHFKKDGEAGKEIVEDIEQRIAEILSQRSTSSEQPVTLENINQVIHTLGNVDDFIYEEVHNTANQEFTEEPRAGRRNYRRLYRDPDQRFLGGVASGLAQYFDTDPVLIRLAFIALIFLKGFGVLLYLILWLAVPKARSAAEKLQMKGRPVNLSTIQETVQDEIDKSRGNARSSENQGLLHTAGLVLIGFLKFFMMFLGILFLIFGSIFMAVFLVVILGFTNILGATGWWPQFQIPEMASFFQNSTHYYAALISLIVLSIIPIIGLIYGGIKILFHIKTRHPIMRAFLFTSWILALILFITIIAINVPNSPIEASGTDSYPASRSSSAPLVLGVYDNLGYRGITHHKVFHYGFHYSKYDDAFFNKAEIAVRKSNEAQASVRVIKKIKNVDASHADHFLRKVDYNWMQQDSLIRLDRYYQTDDDYFWLFPNVQIEVLLPPGQQIILKDEVCEMLNKKQQQEFCTDSSFTDKVVKMREDGKLERVK